MPTTSKSYSRVSINFLDWLALELGVHIQHAESKDGDENSEGEHKLLVPGRKFKADGYCEIEGVRVCIEFHGCAWHGCTECFVDRDTVLKDKTRDERLRETQVRAEAVRAAGYKLVEIWEHEWDDIENDKALKAAFVARVRKQLELDRDRDSNSNFDAGAFTNAKFFSTSTFSTTPKNTTIQQTQQTLFEMGVSSIRVGEKRARE